MTNLRKAEERGVTREPWLDSRHSFSFAGYYDPQWMGFRALRVINDDRVAPAAGFPLHPHSDMEILTFIHTGALEHRDSLGHRETIRAGEVQRITAGRGIRHSEYNPSTTEEVRLLQIWILPDAEGLEPSYETRRFSTTEPNALRLIASRDGRDGSAVIHQDVRLYAGRLGHGASLTHPLAVGRHAWVQMIAGQLDLNGTPLGEGDGAALSGEPELILASATGGELLLFDLA